MSDQEKFKEIEANINSLYEEMKALSERIEKIESRMTELENASHPHELSDDEVDDLYEEAVEIVRETGKASTSYIQRRFGIGYSHAARLIDKMEEEGIVGPAIGSKPREVFK